MLGYIAKLFRGRDRLVRLSLGSDRNTFIRAFGESNIVVIEALDRPGYDADNGSEEEFLSEVNSALQKTYSEGAVELMIYERDGSRRLPIFSSTVFADLFCGQYVKHCKRSFMTVKTTIKGYEILSYLDGVDVVALNDWTSSEYILTQDDIARLGAACSD